MTSSRAKALAPDGSCDPMCSTLDGAGRPRRAQVRHEVRPAHRSASGTAKSGSVAYPDAAALRAQPLKQVWFDHLLALSMIGVTVDRAKFVLLAPDANPAATAVDSLYRTHVMEATTYERRSLEEVAGVVRQAAGPGWPHHFTLRYLTPTAHGR